jgi:uncharacterized protein
MSADPHPISGVATSITLFLGGAADGPHDTALRIGSFTDYVGAFGGLDARTLLGHAVMHFFENGGTDAYVVRLTNGSGADLPVLTPGRDEFHAVLLSDKVFGPNGIADSIDLFNLLCVPGESDPSTLAKLQAYCARRRALLLIDADSGASVASLKQGPPTDLVSSAAANAAMFFPWLRAPDPLHAGASGEFPPSGFVAGIFARNDRTRGVWKAAAGLELPLVGASQPAIALSDSDLALLNSTGIDCIRKFPGQGTVLWGERTLLGSDASQSEWKYIPIRRLALFIEESMSRGTRWAAFEPNDETLWAQLRTSVGGFMLELFRKGAFRGIRPAEAFFVRCDATTTTQSDIDAGLVNIVVGFAPLQASEFVVLSLRQLIGG